jgi:hypothetical protein
MHQIERHPQQLKIGEGLEYRVEVMPASSGDGGG